MRALSRATAMLVVTAGALFLAREPLLLAAGDFLVVQDELHPVDVIHVIAGPDHRTNYAIQLYKQGNGEHLFFTGGWCTVHEVFHGLHGRALAEQAGIPEDAIAINDTSVTSTYAEAERLREFIQNSKTPIRSVIVVSDPHHMRRARWTYRKVLGKEIEILMAPVPFENTPIKRRWWSDWASQNFVKEEYMKFFYYIARYQVGWGPTREWLASLDRE